MISESDRAIADQKSCQNVDILTETCLGFSGKHGRTIRIGDLVMAVKLFEQVYPGQNAPDLKPKKNISPQEWERKQRLKEYRISARREKRNRKSDEKKQRKLNATILRRMVRRYPSQTDQSLD